MQQEGHNPFLAQMQFLSDAIASDVCRDEQVPAATPPTFGEERDLSALLAAVQRGSEEMGEVATAPLPSTAVVALPTPAPKVMPPSQLLQPQYRNVMMLQGPVIWQQPQQQV